MLLLAMALPVAYADPYHDAFAFPLSADARPGFSDSEAIYTSCKAYIDRVARCPGDPTAPGVFAWCDFAVAEKIRVVPDLPFEAPTPLPSACTSTLGDQTHRDGPNYNHLTDVSGTSPTGLRLSEEQIRAGVPVKTYTLRFPNYGNPNAPITKSTGSSSPVLTGTASFLSARLSVEVATFFATVLLDGLCAPPAGAGNAPEDGTFRPRYLLPQTCEELPTWKTTGRLSIDALRTDALALPRHLGEEVLHLQGTSDPGTTRPADRDLAVALAVAGRTVELVVSEESEPTAALSAWARSRPATAPGTGGTPSTLDWAQHPLSSGLWAASVALASLPQIRVAVASTGQVEASAATVRGANLLALLQNLQSADAPEHLPFNGLPDGARCDAWMQSVSVWLETVAESVALARNGELFTGVDATSKILPLVADALRGGALVAGLELGKSLEHVANACDAVAAAVGGGEPGRLLDVLDEILALIPGQRPEVDAVRRVARLSAVALSEPSEEEMRQALEAAAHPPGGWIAKRSPDANRLQWSIVTAYVGIGAGADLSRDVTPTPSLAPIATIGPELGFASRGKVIPSVMFQAVVLDLGAMGVIPLDDSQPAPTFSTVFSPGAAVHVGLGRSPFALSLPVEWTPLREKDVRASLNITGDLVLFP